MIEITFIPKTNFLSGVILGLQLIDKHPVQLWENPTTSLLLIIPSEVIPTNFGILNTSTFNTILKVLQFFNYDSTPNSLISTQDTIKITY